MIKNELFGFMYAIAKEALLFYNGSLIARFSGACTIITILRSKIDCRNFLFSYVTNKIEIIHFVLHKNDISFHTVFI